MIEALKPRRTFLTHLSHSFDHGPTQEQLPPRWPWPTTGCNWSFEWNSCLSSRISRRRILLSGVWHEMSPDPVLVDRLNQHGQSHLLRWWERIERRPSKRRLAAEVGVDRFRAARPADRRAGAQRRGRRSRRRSGFSRSTWFACRRPMASAWCAAAPAESGADALAAGEVGVILVAGGSGTRLGFEGPKGTFPIGPVSSASLFQIHAEKIVALGRRYGRTDSPVHHDQPREPRGDGRLLREPTAGSVWSTSGSSFRGRCRPSTGRRARSCWRRRTRSRSRPTAMAARWPPWPRPGPDGTPSCLDEMRERGVRTLFYFQVDNPLVRIADPSFIGLHREADAEVSFKVVERLSPDEKLGVVVTVDGRPQVIEYSDLPAELAGRRVPEGPLELWAGSIAVHILERSFIERLVGEHRLPFHRAIKKVAYVDDSGPDRSSRPSPTR